MPTQYIHMLHVVAPNGVAQQLSALSYQLCPDVGENNVSIPLNANGDDAEPTHYACSAPVTQRHIDALFDAGLGATAGVRWACTDRAGLLQKWYKEEPPEAVLYSFDDLLADAGLKLRVEPNPV